MANEIAIDVTGTATKGKAVLADTRAEAKRTGQQIGDALDQGFKTAEQAGSRARKKIGDELDKTRKDAKDAGGKAGHAFGTQFGENVETAISGGAADVLSGLLDKVKGGGGLAAAGAGIGFAVLDSITTTLEQGNIGGVLAARLEGAEGQAARLGKLAGTVYADNFADSLEQAAGGIQAIMQNKLLDPSASDSAITAMTEKLLAAAKVVDEEANTVARAARQMLVNGLAKSADEAFDTIVQASQRGLNVNGDLIDTVVEYSTKFRDLGLTGQQSLGLISQAMDAGARNTDFAADALKEFAIRAIDGTQTTVRGFTTIGENAEQMGYAIAAGGDTAKTALGETLNSLRAIHDPVMRNQAAVDLFGTKAEDLGDALFAMDLDTVAAAFGDVANATEKASASMTTTGSVVESTWRKVKQGATDALGWLFAGMEAMHGNNEALTGLVVTSGDYGKTEAESAEAARQRARDAATAWTHERDQITRTTKTLAEFIQTQQDAAHGQIDVAEAQIRFEEALDNAAESVKKNGKTLDITNEKGRANKQTLIDLTDATFRQVEAMEHQGATADQLAGFMGTARDRFIGLAMQMGLSRDEASRLADQLKLIPNDIRSRYTLEGGGSALDTIRTLHGALVNLTNREWVASVSVTQHTPFGGGRIFKASGGPISNVDLPHAATGGIRWGSVITDELGPEIKQLPDGSMVIPTGWSREIMARAFGADRQDRPPARDVVPAVRDDERTIQLLVRALERVTVTLDGRAVGMLQGRQASLLGRTG